MGWLFWKPGKETVWRKRVRSADIHWDKISVIVQVAKFIWC